jgi:SPFH domain/Band 7 family protein
MPVIAILFWCCLLLLVSIRRFVGWPTTVTLLQYQNGVLYRKGYPVRDVGPGRSRVWAGIEKVITVDTRPIPVSFENRAVALTDGQTAVFGFSGDADVSDARKALYSAQNLNQVPAYVLLVCSRSVLNQQSGANLKIVQNRIEEQIAEQAKARLKDQGFNLLSFRLTQLSIAGPPPESENRGLRTASA